MLTVILSRVVRPGRARSVFYLYRAGFSLFWAMMTTLSLLYQVQVAGLNPFQLVLVGTVLEATCFLGEVPTSVVADRFSRRTSVLIGLTVMGAGFLLQSVPSFTTIVLAQVVWGLGYTFTSGADIAWIVDEVGADRVQPVLTRATQLSLITNFVGILTAGGLGLIHLRVPLVVSGAGFICLAGLLLVRMPEEHFAGTDPGERVTFGSLFGTFRRGVVAARRSRTVRTFLLVGLLTGLSSEVFDRLWTARVVQDLGLPNWFGISTPAVWFTGFALIGSLLALAVSVIANRLRPQMINSVHPNNLMAVLILLQIAGVVGFAMSGALLPALLAMWLRDAARTLAHPVQNAWLHRNLESETRATVSSLTGQADALGQVIGGPPLGALASRTTIPIALLAASAIFAPAGLAFQRLRPPRTDDHLDESGSDTSS